MKSLLISVLLISCFINGSFGNKMEKFKSIPGCEKMDDFKGLNTKSCCETYPQMTNLEGIKKCKGECKSSQGAEMHCCLTKCSLNADKVLNETGFIDMELMTNFLNENVKNDEGWVKAVKATIETCKTEAPEGLEKWKKFDENASKCDGALNIAMKHCIRRNLFFNCPSKKGTSECTEYETFGKGCPIFPMSGGNPHGRQGQEIKQVAEPKKDDDE